VKIIHFQSPEGLRFGIQTDAGIVDIRAVLAKIPCHGVPTSLDELLLGGVSAQESLKEYIGSISGEGAGAPWLLAEEKITFAPCVPHPGKILCIGLNYRRHAYESGAAVPATPVIFSKFSNALAGHRQSVRLEKNAEQYDYEAELVVVMGRRARFITEADALNYVFGYCTGNDLSARDLQTRTSQWLLGKTLDHFMPIGPYLVTADEAGNAQSLGIWCWVNGVMRQNSNTKDMVFTIAQLVSYLSQYITLEPGDLISTGTPEGVILGMKEKIWLKPNDVVEIEVEGLGKLVNVMDGETE
jgi:2-keto-4-pentenoate hydratase/2-oxohepta-3-ene-1,7-dioic acid hydratase in catechol pathway